MPFLTERPLVRFGDADFFVGRAREIEMTLSAVDMGLNVAVFGAPGSGKTSFLAALGRSLLERRTNRRYSVIAPATSSASELMEAIVEEIVGPPHKMTDASRVEPTGLAKSQVAPSVRGRTLAAIQKLCAHLNQWDYVPEDEDGPIYDDALDAVILLDSVTPGAAAALFAGYVDEMSAVRAIWIVALRGGGAEGDKLGYFFDAGIDLGALTEDEARTLLNQRLGSGASKDALKALKATDNLLPRALVTAAREYAFAGQSATPRANVTQQARDAAWLKLNELGRPASMLAVEMRGRGPISASDDSLLGAMGWSRSRASTVLSQLEKAGLVSAVTESNAISGRPRKLYSLIPELES